MSITITRTRLTRKRTEPEIQPTPLPPNALVQDNQGLSSICTRPPMSSLIWGCLWTVARTWRVTEAEARSRFVAYNTNPPQALSPSAPIPIYSSRRL